MKKKILIMLVGVLAVGVLAGCNGQQDQKEVMEKDVVKNEMNKEMNTEMKKEDNMAMMEDKTGKMEKEESEMKMGKYMDISVEKAKMMIDQNSDLIVIDVSPKYAEGHLPGAVNYYVGDGSLDKAIPSLDKEATYLVYCHVDSASILGSQKLVDAGFENVYRLEGNYSAWTDAGYMTEK